MAADRPSKTATHHPRVAILAADGVEQVEVTTPREALGSAGCEVAVLTPGGERVRGYHYLEPQDELDAAGAVEETDPADFDLMVVPGGLGGPDTLRHNESAVEMLRSHARAGKPIGVICHGPWLLVEAGVLDGRTITCVPQLRSDVTNAGATYVDEEVHVDRTRAPVLVSGRNFKAAKAFAETLVREFAS
jgi:protease I